MIVQHISADATGNVLLDAISASTSLKCMHAKNKTKPQAGYIYLAPSDHHIMLDEDKTILVTKGTRENRSRSAIDPLFRSAAVSFGKGAIGILLTGYLDDGTSGMEAIKRCGGVTVVQDPKDAEYPDMPRNALVQGHIDYCIPLSGMGALLMQC